MTITKHYKFIHKLKWVLLLNVLALTQEATFRVIHYLNTGPLEQPHPLLLPILTFSIHFPPRKQSWTWLYWPAEVPGKYTSHCLSGSTFLLNFLGEEMCFSAGVRSKIVSSRLQWNQISHLSAESSSTQLCSSQAATFYSGKVASLRFCKILCRWCY